MLKKQTIWLLTMLSLMIVLSVYYMTSDGSEDIAFINEGSNDSQETAGTDGLNEEEADVNNIENIGGDELFATIRMNLEDQRSMEKTRLEKIVASSEASTEEKNEAWESISAIEELTTKESILEESILASAKYEDVLVRKDGNAVHVHVKTENLPEEEAINIMQMVKDEFGEITVDVNFGPTAS
ncbi:MULTISPECIES: SpoIIIAH-like family protein [unclassified Virgibacillus]|uniref:SpoIIIAH-like family protein n=1 Tax=unclassified Virgibacillus TaxID=2620237 RepID=UPI0024DE8D89|nr:SpoIIIAH-like family protein [Virgibacillus sp. LDC-1]